MGRWRIGIAFRVVAALLVIATLAAGVGGFALHTFQTLQDDLTTLAEQRLPTILAAAKLDRQAALLSAQAAALVLADSDDKRETEMMRILDLVETLERLITELEDGGAQPRDVATIRGIRTSFVQTLHRLNDLVAERIRIRKVMEATLSQVLETAGASHDQPAPPDDGPVSPWHWESMIAIHSLQAAATATRELVLRREESQLSGSLRQLDDAIGDLPPADRAEASAMRAVSPRGPMKPKASLPCGAGNWRCTTP